MDNILDQLRVDAAPHAVSYLIPHPRRAPGDPSGVLTSSSQPRAIMSERNLPRLLMLGRNLLRFHMKGIYFVSGSTWRVMCTGIKCVSILTSLRTRLPPSRKRGLPLPTGLLPRAAPS